MFRFKAAATISLIIALFTAFVLLPRFYTSSRETIKIPMLCRDITAGAIITDGDIKIVEVGKFGLPSDVIKEKKQAVSMYALNNLRSDKFLYKEDFTEKETKQSLVQKIKNGCVSVQTDLAKCAGGIPRPGDYVKVYIVTRDESTKVMKSTLYKALAQVEVLSVLNSSGADASADTDMGTETANAAAFTSDKNSIPAIVTLNVQYNLQEKLIIEGAYNGSIHLVLINPASIEKELANADAARLLELEKEGGKVVSYVPANTSAIDAGAANTSADASGGSVATLPNKQGISNSTGWAVNQ